MNAIAPGTVDTPMVRQLAGPELDDAAWAALRQRWAATNIPARRMATADEIARAVVALSSDAYPFMTGASILIDGGMTAQL